MRPASKKFESKKGNPYDALVRKYRGVKYSSARWALARSGIATALSRTSGHKRHFNDSAASPPRLKIIGGRTIGRCGDCKRCPKRNVRDAQHRLRMYCTSYGIEISCPATGPIPAGCRLRNA